MVFYSLQFLVLLVGVIILLKLKVALKWQQSVLLLANYVFYAYWDYRFCLLLLLETAIVYYFGRLITKKKQRATLVIPVVLLILILGIFKYYNFFIDSFCNLFSIKNSLSLNLILPLGLSFYTFQALSYLFDRYAGKISEEQSFLKVAVYISFFPQIISGPIVKAKDFLPQLSSAHEITKSNLREGSQIFLLGLMKKVVIADRVGVCVNAVYAAPAAYNSISTICAILAYSVQIYCDFSGYSDMAIGIARILGFDLGRNFNVPYLSKNPTEFWRRWHISLSSWFRDYLYIPLGGNRKGKFRTYLNSLIVMSVCGLWHGANWTFILWGFLHGIALLSHKFFASTVKKYDLSIKNPVIHTIVSILSVIINFAFVSALWVIFRADNMQQARMVFEGIFQTTGITYVNVYVIVYSILLFLIHIYVAFKQKGEANYPVLDTDRFVSRVAVCILIFLTIGLMYVGDTAFIYAQF